MIQLVRDQLRPRSLAGIGESGSNGFHAEDPKHIEAAQGVQTDQTRDGGEIGT